MELKQKIIALPHIKKYYEKLIDEMERQFGIASRARAAGKDIEPVVESKPTTDLADRTENIIGPNGIAKSYREIYKEMKGDRIKTIFKIFKEIMDQKWCVIQNDEKRLEQAVKSCLMLLTEGVVVAPIDGVPSVKISRNFDGTKYVDIYFAGPIRAAGGTAAVFPLILGDYARELLGIDRYKPTGEEIERYIEEIKIYDEIISRQYKLSDEDVRKIIIGCPVCVNGEPTEEREVVAYKDLERVATNRIRGGMCLVVSEGVGLKAMKILTYSKMLGLDWNWLEGVIKFKKTGEKTESIEPNAKYLGKIAAGRPIFCYPSRVGGFRLRYGKARNTGIMGRGIHPATMFLLDGFIAVGTQLKIERPGKSAEAFAVDSIEGPIVKLFGGEVKQLHFAQEAIDVNGLVEKILFLGDMLVTLGDFRKTAHPLVPAGYCEEWWVLELKNAVKNASKESTKQFDFEKIFKRPKEIDCFTATELSIQFGVPLHPKFTHFYNSLKKDEIKMVVEEVERAKKEFDSDRIALVRFQKTDNLKGIFEKICLPHKSSENEIIVEEQFAYPFLKTFGAFSKATPDYSKENLEILSSMCGIEIRDKQGSFIGARMGRPEQAKPRKMVGNPNVLFPIGISGGNTRSINKATEKYSDRMHGVIEVEIAAFQCTNCGETTCTPVCTSCGSATKKVFSCKKCGANLAENYCRQCKEPAFPYAKRKINLEKIFANAIQNLGVKTPELVKGVKGLINAEKIPEPLEKGILRAINGVHIFRDGTIRYEILNAPLTHFKPKEIGTGIEKLKELGYLKDINGNPIEDDGQTIELFPQDLIVNEEAGKFFVKITKFIDEELEKFYGLAKIFGKNSKEDIIGELVLGLAPHTSAAVIGRIIGYSKARVCFANPYFHLAKRRNCDGDQDSLMLLMDALLNFSEHYLPISRGGRMDAPLVFTTVINPTEIDDEAYDIETCTEYPLELYEKSRQFSPPQIGGISRIEQKLDTPEQYSGFGFTHDTAIFDEGPKSSAYILLQKMEEKMDAAAKLQSRIKAVDLKDSLERVLISHFLPDIIGNARSFSRQNFRCTNCNAKYRRIPLKGECTKCNKGNIILTIAHGSVTKYLEIAKKMISKYGLSNYLSQRIDLIDEEIKSVFTSQKTEQKNLFEFA